MKPLYLGPWAGEFGWELCWWNPLARRLAEGRGVVIVAAPASSEHLYEFATKFIPLKTASRSSHTGDIEEMPVVEGCEMITPAARWDAGRERNALRGGWASNTPKSWRLLRQTGAEPVADVSMV